MTTYVQMQPTAETLKRIAAMKRLDVMKPLRRELAQVTRQGQAEAKAAILSTPSKQTYDRANSLRYALARAVRRSARVSAKTVSIRVWVKPTGGKANLGRLVEGSIPWQHPIFGIEGTSVNQESHPWFYETFTKIAARLSTQVRTAVDRALRSL